MKKLIILGVIALSFAFAVNFAQAQVVRTAEITIPEEGDCVSGTLYLGATLIDDDYDPVQWAVRKGTCAAGTNTVLGNVDGHNDPFSWTYVVGDGTYTHTFSAEANISGWDERNYCFIFNPKEDAGEADIRLTVTFDVSFDCDNDNDDVSNIDDLCPGTVVDTPDLGLGVNRHVWYSDEYFTTLIPGKKPRQTDSSFSIADTYGCSCEQILEKLATITHKDYEGHYKYGCSKSVIEDWINLKQVNMCEKDPDNNWQCKEEGATGVFSYFANNPFAPMYINAEGLVPDYWYRVELVNKGSDCCTWEPLNSGTAHDNRVMYYAQADSEGKLFMEFVHDINGYEYVEPNVKNADWVPLSDDAPYEVSSEWIYTGQGWGFVLYGKTTFPKECGTP